MGPGARLLAFALLAASLSLAGCGGELLQDPGFEAGEGAELSEAWELKGIPEELTAPAGARVKAWGAARGMYAAALNPPQRRVHLQQIIELGDLGFRGYWVEAEIQGIAYAEGELSLEVYGWLDGKYGRLAVSEHPGTGDWQWLSLRFKISLRRPPGHLLFYVTRNKKTGKTVAVDEASLKVLAPSFLRGGGAPTFAELAGAFICLTLLAGLLFLAARRGKTRRGRLGGAFINVIVSAITLLSLCLGVEAFVRAFMIESDSSAATLVSELWWKEYWRPINTLGYRDISHSEEDFTAEKKTVFVVGDSFTAGYGIKSIDKTFAGVMRDKLGPDWTVVNISQCGWATKEEFEAVEAYPHAPDAIVLAHVPNDILWAAAEHGMPRFTPQQPADWIEGVIGRSLALNLAYWRIHMLRQQEDRRYERQVREYYENDEVWQSHEKELSQFLDYSRENNAELIVLVFPWLSEAGGEAPVSDNVLRFFGGQGIHTIDAAKILEGRTARELTVNAFDHHPNEAVHAELGALLAEALSPD